MRIAYFRFYTPEYSHYNVMLFLIHVKCLVDTVIKKRVMSDFFFKLGTMYEVRMKKQSPSSYGCSFAVVFLAADLSRCDADKRAVFVIISAASIRQVKVIVLLNEHAINIISVKTMTYRRDFSEVNDSYQRM